MDLKRDEEADAIRAARQYLRQQSELGLTQLPAVHAGSAEHQLASFHASIEHCQACRLSRGRRVVVFGSGSPTADLMFVGEAPGRDEDVQGLPFVGAAGALLTRMIESIGFRRDDVYIANVIKCRPPNNRDPQPDEIRTCEPYLRRQIEIIRPMLICSLGRFATQVLLKTDASMGELRGRLFNYRGIKLVPTYHPAALLRNARWKRPAWNDLNLLRSEYDEIRMQRT